MSDSKSCDCYFSVYSYSRPQSVIIKYTAIYKQQRVSYFLLVNAIRCLQGYEINHQALNTGRIHQENNESVKPMQFLGAYSKKITSALCNYSGRKYRGSPELSKLKYTSLYPLSVT